MRHGWKSLLVGLATVLTVASSSGIARAATCGDLNNSGGRSIADVVLLFRSVLENPDPSPLCGDSNPATAALSCGDMNQDGSISVADVVILFNAVLGNETLFPLCTGPGNVIACNSTVSADVSVNQIWPAGSCAGGANNGKDCDPNNAGTCPGGTCSQCITKLDGLIFVQPNVVLTIKPGAIIQGKKNPVNPPPSALILLRDSKINAQGTQNSPIVMTSDQSPGTRAAGDWGGLALNGRGIVNCPTNECLAEGLTGVPFGGTEANDSSGILRFIRVEFAGRILSPDNELNVVTHNAIGAGTQEDHIEANQGLDDGLEWFGGTVKMHHMVSFGAADDNFDWQLGTQTSLQYGYAQQYGPVFQNSGNNGFEGDNNENGFDNLPRSAPKFCNMTLIGAKGQPQAAGQESHGALLRRGTAGQLAKTIITNFKTDGIQLRDNATAAVACSAGPALTGNLLWRDSLFFNNGPNGTTHATNNSATNPCNSCQLFNLWANNGADSIVPAQDATCTSEIVAAPDPGISTTYPNLSGVPSNAGAVASSSFDCKTLDSFFDTTNYRGAFEPGQPTWLTTPWISAVTN